MSLAWRAISLFLLCICASLAQAGDFFLGPIPVQFVSAGSTITLDLHRFYQPNDAAKLEITGAKGLQVSYDRASLRLQIRIESAARGLVELPFRVSDGSNSRTSLITFAIRSPGQHGFFYHPKTATEKVSVAGSFNGWSKEVTPMVKDGKGDFRAQVALEPGRYTYKIYADDKWEVDGDNPQKEADGFGGTNSLVEIAPSHHASGPAIYADKIEAGNLIVLVAGGETAETVSVAAELANGTTKKLEVKVDPSQIIVSLADLPKDSSIRIVAADKAQQPGNVIRIPLSAGQDFQWQDAIMYYALTDRFSDGDKSNDKPVANPKVEPQANFHGGDWRGIEARIKEGYFEELGVNTIWIAPLNKNPAGAYQEYPEPHRWYTGYHGYWPISPTEVEPHFGDTKALKSLVSAAHEHGLKVIADLVLHHVHAEHPWWKEHRDWFGTLDLPDGTKNLRRWDDYQFTTWFEPYMPTFNFSNPAAVAALIDNSAWWANEYDLDGFRLDAVKHIQNDFWWKFRSALREKVETKRGRPLYLVGETFKDRAGIDSFVGPNMLDGQFDFPLYDSIKDSFGEGKVGLDSLETSLEASEQAYGKESLMSPLIGNHDKGRFMAYADGDLPDAKGAKEEEVGWQTPPQVDDKDNYRKIELAQAFLLAIDGVPMIYYGDEIGMTGAGDPDNRRDMRFGDQVTAPEKKVLANFERLTRIRTKHPALRNGSRRVVVAEKDLLGFVRAQLDDRVFCLFNRGTGAREIECNVGPELADGSYLDELSGREVLVADGKMKLSLSPQSAAFFTAQAARKP